jgi:hypothetical protein
MEMGGLGTARAREVFFLKRIMHTPDSLQRLSGAQRTAHNSCPVNHRTENHKARSVRSQPVH